MSPTAASVTTKFWTGYRLPSVHGHHRPDLGKCRKRYLYKRYLFRDGREDKRLALWSGGNDLQFAGPTPGTSDGTRGRRPCVFTTDYRRTDLPSTVPRRTRSESTEVRRSSSTVGTPVHGTPNPGIRRRRRPSLLFSEVVTVVRREQPGTDSGDRDKGRRPGRGGDCGGTRSRGG